MEPMSAVSPRRTARIAGFFYLVTVVTRIIADGVIRDRIVVAGDAAATAANMLAHAAKFRLGFVADMVAFGSYIALAALLYLVFKPVSRSLSLVAAFFGLGCAIAQAFSSVFHLAAVFIVGGSEYLKVFSVAQLQALALLSLKLRAIGYHNVGLVFLGVYCLLLGCLIYRSTFMPRILGLLVAAAGLAYLPFLYPPLAAAVLPWALIPAAIGQIALTLWLLIVGLNDGRTLPRTA